MALHTENLPPTKSQNPNTFLSAIPNLEVSGILVEQAHICELTMRPSSVTFSFEYCSNSHLRQLFALRMVSAVVKVLELTKNKVSSTSRFSIDRWKSMGSTLAKKRSLLPWEACS